MFTFYILTDTHYVSKQLWEEGPAFSRREKGDQIALKISPEIFDSFVDLFLADDEADTLLVTGDLVNCGEKINHLEFIQKLRAIQEKGKRVFVTTATHDYCGMEKDENFFRAVKYLKDRTEPTEHVYKTELLPLYYDFGPKQSDSLHEESGSYSLRLTKGLRLIAINDNGNGRSHCGLFADGVKWLTEEIEKANENGEKVLLAVHHPVLPPWDIYAHLVDFEMYGGYQELRALMCQKNVRVIFTGHTHVQNIRKYEDTAGRYFYDVSTAAATAAGGKMRKVVVDGNTCRITSLGLDKIKGIDTKGQTPEEYIYGLNFIGLFEKNLRLVKENWHDFAESVDGFIGKDLLQKHKLFLKPALTKAQTLRMSTLAKLGKKYNGLIKPEITGLREMIALPELFTVLRHVFKGNAPFTPDTVQYQVFTGVTKKLDAIQSKVHLKAVDKLIPPGASITDVTEGFLYNNRTGNDDEIEIEL